MAVSKKEAQVYSLPKKAKYAEVGIVVFVVLFSILVFLYTIPKLYVLSVPSSSSGINVISSVNYNYLFAVNYLFVGVDTIIGLTAFLFGILSFLALYRHRLDNAPITAMILNLNKSSNPFSLLILASILVLIAIASFFVSILTSYSTVSFLSGVMLGTVAFILLAISLINLSLKYFVRFAFSYE